MTFRNVAEKLKLSLTSDDNNEDAIILRREYYEPRKAAEELAFLSAPELLKLIERDRFAAHCKSEKAPQPLELAVLYSAVESAADQLYNAAFHDEVSHHRQANKLRKILRSVQDSGAAAPLQDTPQLRIYTLIFAFSEDLRRVLLLKKATPYWQAGLWNGPGGKVEVGETNIAGAIRELKEETGIVAGELVSVLDFSCDCERFRDVSEKGEHRIAVYSAMFPDEILTTAKGSEVEPVQVFDCANVVGCVSYVPHLIALCRERLSQREAGSESAPQDTASPFNSGMSGYIRARAPGS